MYAWEIVLISLLFVIIECAIMELQSTPVGLKVNRKFHLAVFPLLLVAWVYTWTHEFSNLVTGACVYAAIATFMFLLSGGSEKDRDVDWIAKMETIITVIYIAAMFSHLNEIVIS